MPDAIRRPRQQHRGMTRTSCQLQSECKNISACTMGLRACDQGHEKDVGSIPALQHSFVMLTPHHPALLQCRIDSPEPLRQVYAQLRCSEHMELIGHCYDRKIGQQLFQKDILPGQFNAISWRIHMPVLPPEGIWLCTVILTASNDAGQPVRHLLPFHMPAG